MRNAWILVAIAAALAALACGTGPTEAPEPTATPTWQQWLGQQIAGGKCSTSDHTMEYSNENRTPPYSADFTCIPPTTTPDPVAEQVEATVAAIRQTPGAQTVIEPSGGSSLAGSSVTSCDQVFKNQLVRQVAAHNASRMNQVKTQVQQRQDECTAEAWNPVVIGAALNASRGRDHWRGPMLPTPFDVGTNNHRCATLGPPVGGAKPTTGNRTIGGLSVPSGLIPFVSSTDPSSGRDEQNNIIVFFSSDASRRPSDGAPCWMYFERFGSWVSGSQRYIPR